jgi:hypothetical protein
MSLSRTSFTAYMMDFYGPDGVYSELDFNESQIEIATGIYKMRLAAKGKEFYGDTVDRENVRDIILTARNHVVPEFARN